MKQVNYSEISRTRQMVQAKRKGKRNLVFGILLMIIVAGLGSYFYFTKDEVIEKTVEGLNVQMQKDWISYEDSLSKFGSDIEEVDGDIIDEIISNHIKSMSLDNKISQLIITTPESLIGISQVIQAGQATKKKIEQYPVGGLIYSEKNFDTVNQLHEMINSILIYSAYPMMMCINEVGATRIENTHTKLPEINVNLLYREGELIKFIGDNENVFEDLKVGVVTSENKAVEMLSKEFDMIIVESDYEKYHNVIYKAVIDEEIDIESIEAKLKTILEYKITKM